MRRSRRNLKRSSKEALIESSSDEDEPLIEKASPPVVTIKKTNEDTSSSDSDIESYLQPIDKIDLNSSFFRLQQQEKPPQNSFEAIESDIFAGVTRLSDSEESDNEIEKSSVATRVNFDQLNAYTKKIEEAKAQVENYKKKNKKINNKEKENVTNVSELLAAGEKLNLGKEESKELYEALHSSDFESLSSDTEKGDWEEVKPEILDDKPKAGLPKEGLQITIDVLPDTMRKKTKKLDLLAALKRRLNRIRKENQLYIHKVSLLCWIAHGNFLNSVINNEKVLSMALSLVPSEKSYPSDRTDLGYLEQILLWYKKTVKLIEKVTPIALHLNAALQIQINKKEANNKKTLVYIFIAILRALGIQCRLVLSFKVEPLRPPASDLHSLSTKDNEASTSAKSSKYFKKTPDKGEGDAPKKVQEKRSKSPKPDDDLKAKPTKRANSNKSSTTEDKNSLKPKAAPRRRKSSKSPDPEDKAASKVKAAPKKTRSKSPAPEDKTALKQKAASRRKSSKSLDPEDKAPKRTTSQSPGPEDKTVSKVAPRRKSSRSQVLEDKATLEVKAAPKRTTLKSPDPENKTASKPKAAPRRKSSKSPVPENDSNVTTKLTAALKRTSSKSSNPEEKFTLKAKGTSSKESIPEGEDKNTHTLKPKDIIKVKLPSRKKKIAQLDGAFTSESESEKEDQLDGDLKSSYTQLDGATKDNHESSLTQLDGATEDDGNKMKKKPNLLKLKQKDPPLLECCSSKQRTKAPLTKPNESLMKLRQLNQPSIKVTSPSKSNYFKPDVREDIVKIVKSRLVAEKYKERQKKVNKRSLSGSNDDDEDSDYLPEPIKKKHHDSEDDFLPKVKVKKRVQVKHPVIEESDEEKKQKRGVDVWCEVFLETEEKWISVDVVKGQVHCVNELYARATHPVSYVVAWNNDNTIKDITQRYCVNFNTVTRKLRTDSKWWKESLQPFVTKNKTARDREEDEELERQQLEKPLPTVIGEYKNHPLYVLQRHLLKFQAIYPQDAVSLGFVRKEPVYSRDCVYTLHSRDIWLKHAKVVRAGEKPYKIVKARPKYDKLSNTMITDQMLEIFGPWQVDDYIPPTAENGVVPRNAYGNVELFKACMLPKKTTHLQLPGLNKVAKRMNIDCAPAVVGFDFHSGWSHPTYDGFVVCEEFADVLIAAWELEQEEIEKREEEKMEKRVYGNWKRLIKGLLIRERLKKRYNFGEPSTSQQDDDNSKGKKKPSKGAPKLSTKKHKIESGSESD